MSEREMRGEILALVREYCAKYHAPKADFAPGDRLPYAARVYDHEEMENLVQSALEFWLTAGHSSASGTALSSTRAHRRIFSPLWRSPHRSSERVPSGAATR